MGEVGSIWSGWVQGMAWVGSDGWLLLGPGRGRRDDRGVVDAAGGGSTRACERLRAGSPRTGVGGCSEDGWVTDPPLREIGPGTPGWLMHPGVWFDTVLRRTPNRLTTNGRRVLWAGHLDRKTPHPDPLPQEREQTKTPYPCVKTRRGPGRRGRWLGLGRRGGGSIWSRCRS